MHSTMTISPSILSGASLWSVLSLELLESGEARRKKRFKMQIFCYLFRNDYVAFKAETWDETIKLLEWKNLYLVKLKKDRVIELTQPIQQLFRPVHITHVSAARCCVSAGRWKVSYLCFDTVHCGKCRLLRLVSITFRVDNIELIQPPIELI